MIFIKLTSPLSPASPPHFYFGFEDISGNQLINDYNINAKLQGSPRRVEAVVKQGLQLDGSGDYVDFGNQMSACLGNLDFCQNGVLYSFWLKPENLQEGSTFLSTGGNGVRLGYRLVCVLFTHCVVRFGLK